MSSVVIAGNTSGSVTLSAPDVAGTTTLTLPATSGTVITGSGGVTGVAQGGTGASSLTANNVLLGNGTSAVQVVAPGTSGNILTSNGTTWTSAAAPAGGFSNIAILTASTTWTIPSGITKAKVTVVGGGGGGGNNTGNGGVGGAAIAMLTGLTPGGTVSVTIGAGGAANNGGNGSAGGTSSFGAYLSATGGTGGVSSVGNNQNCGAGTVSSGTELFRSITSTNAVYQNGYIAYITPGSFSKPRSSGGTSVAYSTSGIPCAGAYGEGESGGTSNDAAAGCSGVVIVEY